MVNSSERVPLEVGPFDPSLPGPMIYRLNVSGEVISQADVELGYSHRGLEKAFEHQDWTIGIPYADRVSSEDAIFGELAYCTAVENILGVEVPVRAQRIRILLSELTRISAHLKYIISIARMLETQTIIHYVLRDREKILDLFELLCGSRFSINFLRFGGVKFNVSEGFIERALGVGKLIRKRLSEYNQLFSYNQAFLERTRGVGIINSDQVRHFGLTGPNARASGSLFDVRKAHPYSGYQELEFATPTGRGSYGIFGDCHDRYLLRLDEIAESLRMIQQVSDELTMDTSRHALEEDKAHAYGGKIPRGEAYARVESSRGMMSCYVVSEGGPQPARVQFRTPSAAAILLSEEILREAYLSDMGLILASLQIEVAEVDR